MPIVIEEVVSDVISRPATEITAAEPGRRPEQKPVVFDEMRRRLERAFRLAARLAAD